MVLIRDTKLAKYLALVGILTSSNYVKLMGIAIKSAELIFLALYREHEHRTS